MRVVLTRESGHNQSLRDLVPDGCDVTEVALTSSAYYPESDVARHLETWSPGSFESFVVTSARVGPYLAFATRVLAPDAEVFSAGPATTHVLDTHGLRVTGEAAHAAVELAPLITRGPVLLLGAKVMRDELRDTLHKSGLRIEHVACYETLPLAPSDEGASALAAAHVVFIGAPSAWRVAQGFIDDSAWVVVPGPSTASVVRLEHERVLEGWEPSLRDTLATLERSSD